MKIALVSGGTDGMGKGAVLELLNNGFKVSTFSRTSERCNKLNAELGQKFSEDTFLVTQADVTNDEELQAVVDKTLQTFEHIDVLINNAGSGYYVECDKVDMKQFRAMMELNVISLAHLTKLVVPHMKQRKSGLIINLASISGKRAFAQGEFYSATKFGVMGYSEGLRNELKGTGIKVSTICPGMVKTDFFSDAVLEARRKALNKDTLSMLAVGDISKVIGLICTQSEGCDIQDITIMPSQ